MSKRQKKTTRFEYEELISYVECNKILLHGKTKPLEANVVKHLWQAFAAKINNLAGGPFKSGDQWKKIFAEWKVNIKRKSRLIEEEIVGTGGGPRSIKPLTDLEERMLNVISKAHLGVPCLPDDTLGNAEEVHQDEPTDANDVANHVNPEFVIILNENEGGMSPTHRSGDDAIPCTVDKTPSIGPKRCTPGRYTNSILEDACDSFKRANDDYGKTSETLTEALNTFTEVFKLKVEADMLRAKAEMAKAKCLHFQTFGNLDDF